MNEPIILSPSDSHMDAELTYLPFG
uniref:Uncharacterized protein n=1 Tax=Arundo donax TaxID=35708 RepID=A0A0A9C4U4_ARUDO